MPTHSSQENRVPLGMAGLLYFAIIALGLTSEVGLRASLIDWSDGVATGAAIRANPVPLRLSILFDMGMAACDVALAVVFYRVLRGIDETRALLAMVLRLMQAAVIGASLLFLIGGLGEALRGADPLPFLALHAQGYDLGLFFFGLNALVMAGLLCRFGAPRLVAGGIAGAGLVYIAGSVTRVVAPDWNVAMQPAYLWPVLAETALMVWLLWRGFGPAKDRQ